MSYKTALLLTLTVSIGCGPYFRPKDEWGFNGFRHLESVPIVVVARIERNAVTVLGRKPFVDESVPDDPLALLKIRVSIEKVLKGSVPPGTADFFYVSEAFPHGPRGDGFFSTGTFHDILLLRREKGKLRLMRDVRAHCAATVYSGAHPNFNPRPGEPLSEQLIDLFLTPGSGATEIGMVRAIFEEAPMEISPEYTAKKLLVLAASQPPVVRTAACLQFRDLVGGLFNGRPAKAPALSTELEVPGSDAERWYKLGLQNGAAKIWWAGGPGVTKLPSTSLPPDGPRGLALCRDDNALGVPPLRQR